MLKVLLHENIPVHYLRVGSFEEDSSDRYESIARLPWILFWSDVEHSDGMWSNPDPAKTSAFRECSGVEAWLPSYVDAFLSALDRVEIE